MQFCIHSVILQKRLVSTLFDQFAIFEHEDHVCVADSAEMMCDDDGRSTLHQLVQGFDDRLFGGRIQTHGRLVKNQDGRIANDRPGDGNSLALTARERDAALADHRVVAVGHFLDEFAAHWPVRQRA